MTVSGSGTVIGYRSAKVACESVCNATAAHMCSSEEVIRSAQIGAVPIPPTGANYWVASGAWGFYSPEAIFQRDCLGWTTNIHGELGGIAEVGGADGGEQIYINNVHCDTQLKIACCL